LSSRARDRFPLSLTHSLRRGQSRSRYFKCGGYPRAVSVSFPAGEDDLRATWISAG